MATKKKGAKHGNKSQHKALAKARAEVRALKKKLANSKKAKGPSGGASKKVREARAWAAKLLKRAR